MNPSPNFVDLKLAAQCPHVAGEPFDVSGGTGEHLPSNRAANLPDEGFNPCTVNASRGGQWRANRNRKVRGGQQLVEGHAVKGWR